MKSSCSPHEFWRLWNALHYLILNNYEFDCHLLIIYYTNIIITTTQYFSNPQNAKIRYKILPKYYSYKNTQIHIPLRSLFLKYTFTRIIVSQTKNPYSLDSENKKQKKKESIESYDQLKFPLDKSETRPHNCLRSNKQTLDRHFHPNFFITNFCTTSLLISRRIQTLYTLCTYTHAEGRGKGKVEGRKKRKKRKKRLRSIMRRPWRYKQTLVAAGIKRYEFLVARFHKWLGTEWNIAWNRDSTTTWDKRVRRKRTPEIPIPRFLLHAKV